MFHFIYPGFKDIALFALRSACNSLLSPYAWTECRPYINSVCVSVAVMLEVANPIPGAYKHILLHWS